MSQENSHKTVEGIARIGIDLAKNVFHLAAMDSRDCLLLQKRVARYGLLEFLQFIKSCLAGMEACAGDKDRLLGISKRGDCYARTLLVVGAQSLLY